LGYHGGAPGKSYRRVYDGLEAEFGPLTVLGRLMAGRCAASWVELEQATRALSAARRQRTEGRWRRPSAQAVERLARRAGLADSTFSQAFDKLQALGAERRRRPASIASLVAASKRSGG
jgi:hypothetical protein